jgi:hypothetical protein
VTRRRLAAAALVGLTAALGLALALGRADDAGQPWRTVHDGIALTHPAGWSVQRFGRHCRRVGPGVLVTNLGDRTFRRRQLVDGCTSEWDLAGIPSHYVLVDIWLFARPPRRGPRETPVPLLLSRFEHAPDGTAFKVVSRNGVDYVVTVRVGPAASQRAQDEIAHVIGSVEFRRPPRG